MSILGMESFTGHLSDTVSTKKSEDAPLVGVEWINAVYAKLVQAVMVVWGALGAVYSPIARFLETHPMILEVGIPLLILLGAWIILPKLLRKLHEWQSAAMERGLHRPPTTPVPYELSVWKAMENPLRTFATILTMLELAVLFAPDAVEAGYITQFWTGGGILCIVWFLYNWKTSVLNSWMSTPGISVEDKDSYLTMETITSLVLALIAGLGLAEAYGLAIVSLLTVGGIGGVAAAFAAKDILGNILSGVSLSISKPFTVGDTIKSGDVQGKVERIGLHSTLLLNTDKNPVTVPNSYFSSQVIINISQAKWAALSVKIPVRLESVDKLPIFSKGILDMLNSHPRAYVDEDKPRCFVSEFTQLSMELSVTANFKDMTKDEFLVVEQDIFVEISRIITSSGAVLGGQRCPV